MKKTYTIEQIDEIIQQCPVYTSDYSDSSRIEWCVYVLSDGGLCAKGDSLSERCTADRTPEQLGLPEDCTAADIVDIEQLDNPAYISILQELQEQIEDVLADRDTLICDHYGEPYGTIDEALEAHTIDEWAEYMIDSIREAVHDELAPCTDAEFLARYLELSPCDLVIGR